MRHHLTTFEHQSIPVGDGLGTSITPKEAEQLTLLGELRPGFCERRHRSVRVAQYSGVVNLGERVLEILPKVDDGVPPEECRGLLLRLLRESADTPLFRHLSAGQSLRQGPLLEIFIAAFFDTIAEIIRGGLIRQYQEREEDLRVVRGRIVGSRQFAVHSNRPDRIACRFDELTADNTWNQLLKAGLRVVQPWIGNIDLARRWAELIAVFDEVDDSQAGRDSIDRLIYDRHGTRYRSAMEWVRWILELLSPSLRAGRRSAPGLLFDMNALFESAMASVLRRRAGAETSISVQETGHYFATLAGTDKPAFGLRPDLVVRRNGRVVGVGDTKWKRLDSSLMPDPTDIYQMHAYATAFGCENLALIYPWHSGLGKSRQTAFELPRSGTLRPMLHVICVDLHSESFGAMRGQAAPEFGELFG